MTSPIVSHTVQANLNLLPGVKNTIAIASGKGGVGKSTTTVNLAIALQQQGARVGILDADIYGPNQPQLLGSQSRPEQTKSGKIQPIERYHIQSMSMGYLIDPEQPALWRGPMVSTALQQLMNDTAWDDLDYLLIDLPPGTGDVQLTLAQKIPVTGAVIVTTPQEVSLADARKALAMFRKVQVAVLGVIENMSYHICHHCHEKTDLFGHGGGKKMAADFATPFLGEIPLVQKIREQSDQGEPITFAFPDHEVSRCYREIAKRMISELNSRPKNHTQGLASINIIQENI